jgi:hypothetical protein
VQKVKMMTGCTIVKLRKKLGHCLLIYRGLEAWINGEIS